jgi:PucR C-terminal helix-turn-helix domain/GGDEF-like domain
MQRARALEDGKQSVPDRGAEPSAPRSTPLTLVSGAVAGGDLESVATTVAEALDCPVVIAIPALGDPVVWPPGAVADEVARAIAAHAGAVIDGESSSAPAVISEAVAVRIGEQTVGIVVAAAEAEHRHPAAERRAWLEAAAAAASVTALIFDAHSTELQGHGEALLRELVQEVPDDLNAFLGRLRRLGPELASGAVAIWARRDDAEHERLAGHSAGDRELIGALQAAARALIAELGTGHWLAVAPIAGDGGSDPAQELADALRQRGLTVGVSAPRRDLARLHEAVREARLLAELGTGPDLGPAGQDETHRLLIGVLLRDRSELELLRDRTISALADYDARHETELIGTLQAFLIHDGSTTETADSMQLHRHTVGYRLSRVHEVSGLSPYESDGRERLSLGLKAHHILEADRRLELARLTR